MSVDKQTDMISVVQTCKWTEFLMTQLMGVNTDKFGDSNKVVEL